ncbi:hypothetical protein BGW39_003488 [Mortierella sp. 14UC]|nr:hypothetical protein BGW39_003488 [Mortierella sp. 14UC]
MAAATRTRTRTRTDSDNDATNNNNDNNNCSTNTNASTNTHNGNTNNPFDLPELIHRLSRFVASKDALSCALVCKTWSLIFTSVIWFSIDFDAYPRFSDLPPTTIAKYGHHIRIVENVQSRNDIKVLAHPAVNRLRKMKYVDTTGSNLQHILGFEIVARNCSSLLRLDLVPEEPVPPEEHTRLSNYLPVTALIPRFGAMQPSRLYRICIMDLHMTYEGLVTLLQGCPKLTKLGLVNVTILGKPAHLPVVQHPNISFLSCHHQALFRTDPLDNNQPAPSLLLHFPNLKIIELCDHEEEGSAAIIPPNIIIAELSRHCRLLTGLRVQGLRDCSDLVSTFCSMVGRSVSELAFDYDHISLGIITSLLFHATTLQSVKIYRGVDFILDNETVPHVADHFQVWGQFLQLIPRSCAQLRILDIHLHEMDMDVVEQVEWVCRDLRRLRVRVKGLDTRDRVMETIELWRREWRARQNNASTTISATHNNKSTLPTITIGLSIEERVTRHLLKLEKLETVWLGCQDWSPF